MPYSRPTGGATLCYQIEPEQVAESVKVHLILKSTMPFLGKNGHRIKVGFAGAAHQEVSINKKMTWANQYTLMYPTGSSRIIEKVVTLPLPRDAEIWNLEFEPLDPGVVLHKVIVDLGGYKKSHLKMSESGYTLHR